MPTARTAAALLLALAAGCSSTPAPAPADAAVDAPEAPPEDTFIGNGNLVLAWTVRGMPPAMGCAAADAVSVRFPANFIQFMQDTTVPCTQGEYRIDNTLASLAAINAELLDSGGNVIHRYTAEAAVMAGQTTNTAIRFEPPGRLQVNWTINGESPATTCSMVDAMGVVVEAQFVQGNQSRRCPGSSVTFPSVQVGPVRVTGTLVFNGRQTARRVTAMADVPSGATGTVDLAFEAPVVMMQ